MIIRDAVEEDNAMMLEIQKTAAQVGEFEITLLKKDFKKKSNFFKDGFYLVAEDEKTSDILGFLGVGIDYFKIKNKIHKGAYLYDLRKNPKYRGKMSRWLKAITEEVTTRLEKSGIAFYFASVKIDNKPSMKLLEHFNLSPLYTYTSYVLPVLNKKIEKDVAIDNTFDLKELDDFYSEKNKEVDFLPVNIKDTCLDMMRKENRLIKFSYKSAQIIGWDTRDISDVGLYDLPYRYKLLIKILAAITKIIPFVKAPVLHKTLKTFRILQFKYANENDFKILLNTLHGYCYDNDFYLIIFFIPEHQPFNKKLLGLLQFTTDILMAACFLPEVDSSNMTRFIPLPRM